MTKQKLKLDLESELPSKKKKKQSLLSKIVEFARPQTIMVKKKAPLTFNIVLSVALIFIYLNVLVMIGAQVPLIFVFILPIVYILVRQIKLEREQGMVEASKQ
jgi:hypothetical protein